MIGCGFDEASSISRHFQRLCPHRCVVRHDAALAPCGVKYEVHVLALGAATVGDDAGARDGSPLHLVAPLFGDNDYPYLVHLYILAAPVESTSAAGTGQQRW